MSDRPTLDIRGGWAFLSSRTSTVAHRLNASGELEVSGGFHQAISQRSESAALLSRLLPDDAAEMVQGSTAPSDPLTLESLLRGTGWGVLFLELTGQCNERCEHCYASASPDVTTELDWETIASIVDDVSGLGFRLIQFTGGDALLSRHLVPAVQRARAAGIPFIEIYTNGLALRAGLLEPLAAAGVAFAFSVYSHRPEVHDAMTHVAGSHERTLRAIKDARQAGLEVRVSVILRNENQDDLPHVRELLQALGVSPQSVAADRERAVGRGTWSDGLSYDPQMNGDIHSAYPRPTGSGKLSVSYNGNVVPCIFDRDTVLGTVGPSSRLVDVLRKPVQAREPAPPAENKAQLPVLSAELELACSSCQARRTLLKRLAW